MNMDIQRKVNELLEKINKVDKKKNRLCCSFLRTVFEN